MYSRTDVNVSLDSIILDLLSKSGGLNSTQLFEVIMQNPLVKNGKRIGITLGRVQEVVSGNVNIGRLHRDMLMGLWTTAGEAEEANERISAAASRSPGRRSASVDSCICSNAKHLPLGWTPVPSVNGSHRSANVPNFSGTAPNSSNSIPHGSRSHYSAVDRDDLRVSYLEIRGNSQKMRRIKITEENGGKVLDFENNDAN